MAKRTNRMAWGLVAALAVAVLGGIVEMLIYGTQVGPYRDRAGLLVSSPWGIGAGPITITSGRWTRQVGWMVSLGPLHFYRFTRSATPRPTSIRSGTGR